MVLQRQLPNLSMKYFDFNSWAFQFRLTVMAEDSCRTLTKLVLSIA
jgi:hypothetical protein